MLRGSSISRITPCPDQSMYTSGSSLDDSSSRMTSLKVSEPLSQVVEEVLIIAEIQDVTLRHSARIQFI